MAHSSLMDLVALILDLLIAILAEWSYNIRQWGSLTDRDSKVPKKTGSIIERMQIWTGSSFGGEMDTIFDSFIVIWLSRSKVQGKLFLVTLVDKSEKRG